jgi:SAM-dependent methyltransferase
MNRSYWDAVAGDYDGSVLSVFDHDTRGLVGARIAVAGAAVRDARGPGRAADLGCGVGKFVPLLAAAFAGVEACDHAPRALQAARDRNGARDHVRFHQLDLACDPMPFAPVDFVLCVNVLLMPALDEQLRAWRTVVNQVAHEGMLLLVVPSLESAQFETLRAVEAGLDRGESCADAIAGGLPRDLDAADLHLGIRSLDGVPTKHYLRVELEQMLDERHFDVTEVCELSYATALAGSASAPWDRLVTARRR